MWVYQAKNVFYPIMCLYFLGKIINNKRELFWVKFILPFYINSLIKSEEEDEIKIKPKTETQKNGSHKAEECLKERSRSRSSRKLSQDSLGSDSEYIDSPPSKLKCFLFKISTPSKLKKCEPVSTVHLSY